MKKESVLYCPQHFTTEAEMSAFITKQEDIFNTDLASSVEAICKNSDIKIIGLAGPTCSGKTTAAKMFTENLTKNGRTVHMVSVDDFFLNGDILDKRAIEENNGELDYDSIKAIDFNEFENCMHCISSGKKIMIPKYDFTAHMRTGFYEIFPSANDIFLIEGIQVVYPQISELIKKESAIILFICPQSNIKIGEKLFEPNYVRFLRRIVRDRIYRSSDVEFTFYIWNSVRKNEIENIFPHLDNSDIIINSSMAYEIGVLKPYLEKYLGEFQDESRYFYMAQDILASVQDIETIPSILVPEKSLYREFI